DHALVATKGIAEDHVGGLSTYPGQLDQRLHGRRDIARVQFRDGSRHSQQTFRLVPKESRALDHFLQLFRIAQRQRFDVRILREERGRYHVDALISTLRTQNRGDQQLIWIAVVERGGRVGIL